MAARSSSLEINQSRERLEVWRVGAAPAGSARGL
jgi:hypothetical protein